MVKLLWQHYFHIDFFVISKTNILIWNGNAFQKGKFDISEKRCHFYYENLLHSKFKPPYYQSASNKLCHIFFLKLRVLLLTDVRNVQCYFQLLIYVSYHVCLCFQILLVTILNLCYFSGSHQTAISSIKETYLLNYTIWLFKTIFCVSIEIKCFPTCTKHLITWKLKTLTNLEVLKY